MSSFHLYSVKTKNKIRKSDLFNFMKKQKINLQVHYIPIYRHPYYKKFNFDPKNFPNTEYYYERALSLPIYYKLTNSQQNLVTNQLHKGIKIFSK